MCVCVRTWVYVCLLSLPPFMHTYMYYFHSLSHYQSTLVQMINYKTILIICLMENASAFPSLLPFGWRKNNTSSHVYPRASLVAQLVKNPPAMREAWVRSLGWEDALEKEKLPTPVFWPGEFHGLYSPWGCKVSDTTEWLPLSLSTSTQSQVKETLTCTDWGLPRPTTWHAIPQSGGDTGLLICSSVFI